MLHAQHVHLLHLQNTTNTSQESHAYMTTNRHSGRTHGLAKVPLSCKDAQLTCEITTAKLQDKAIGGKALGPCCSHRGPVVPVRRSAIGRVRVAWK